MTIKRTIFVSSPEEIDYKNLGCHFTANLGYNHKGGGSNGGTVEKQYKVDIYAKKYEVNEVATAISNENYPSEQEVVLEMNQEIEVEIYIAKHNGIGYGISNPETLIVNTGSRADIWVKNII